MGKHTQSRESDCFEEIVHEKKNSTSKWSRKFQVLDYHRWHYVKKVLAHKKHHEKGDFSENNSKAIVDDNDGRFQKEVGENSQFEAQKKDPSVSTKKSATLSSPQSTNSTTDYLSPTKISRSAKIKKMISKEVTKRRGRHRRSSTCPVNSELGRTNHSDEQRQEFKDEGLEDETNRQENNRIIEGHKICGLCNTMNITCHLGNRTLIDEKHAKEQEVDDVNFVLHNSTPNIAIKQLPFKGKIDRSASFHHSKDFLDTLDILTMNKDFFLRVLDDHKTSAGDDLLASKKEMMTRSNHLTKFGSFPSSSDISCSNDSSLSSFLKLNQTSSTTENNSRQTRSDRSGSSVGNPVVGRRFKDLRHKIKHLIKENRKERRRIAMDAILHKVPYGQKINEESVSETPCANICESDSCVSPNNGRKVRGKCYKRRSSSLDESLVKYCQLFETTSFNKERRTINSQSPNLRVTDENSSRTKHKGLERIYSSPDLEMFLKNYYEDCDSCSSSRTPNRRIMSFSERNMGAISNLNIESEFQYDVTKGTSTDFDEQVDTNNIEVFTSLDNDDKNDKTNQDNIKSVVESTNNSTVECCDSNDNNNIFIQFVDSMFGSNVQVDAYDHHKDVEVEGSQELSNESPTFTYTIVDEDGKNSLIHCKSPKHNHHPIQASNHETAEFKYIRDILQMSGYLGTQLLGSWYSSNQAVDPSIFVELESCSLLKQDCSPLNEGKHNNHLLLFDMLNEVLLAIYERSVSYWYRPLSSCSRTQPMPKGYRVLEEAWNFINWYIDCSRFDLDLSLDYITTRDFSKYDTWLNLQFDAECVGLELEDLIFEDLLTELIC